MRANTDTNTHSDTWALEICWHVCFRQAALSLWCCWAVQLWQRQWHSLPKGDRRTEVALKALVCRHSKSQNCPVLYQRWYCVKKKKCFKKLNTCFNSVCHIFYLCILIHFLFIILHFAYTFEALLWVWQHVIADTPSEFLDWKSDISLFAVELFGLRRGKWVNLKYPRGAEDGWRGVQACFWVGGESLPTHARCLNSWTSHFALKSP